MSEALVSCSINSIIANQFKTNQGFYWGWFSVAASLGMGCGPFVGGFLYEMYGYLGCFLIFSAVILLTGIVCVLFLIPATVNLRAGKKA